jgi:hypothetical protein
MEGRGRLETRIPARLSRREGRKFGLTVGIAFLVLAGISAWRGHDTVPIVLGALGAAFGLGGLLLPGRMGPVHRVWMRGAIAISRVTTPLLMGIMYFLVITPVGFVRRNVGGHPLRHRDPDGGYWKTRGGAGGGRSDLRRQF